MDVVLTGSFLMLNMARTKGELRDSEERYRNLADNLPDYIVVHDGDLIHYANPSLARLVGRSRETLVGQSIYLVPDARKCQGFAGVYRCNAQQGLPGSPRRN